MTPTPQRIRTSLVYIVAVLGAFLLVALLVYSMQRYAPPPVIDAKRKVERAQALAELRAAEAQALNSTAWINQTNGVVRLRIEDAMRLVERDWGSNPAQARSNLIARVVKATTTPPKPPEKPSVFE